MFSLKSITANSIFAVTYRLVAESIDHKMRIAVLCFVVNDFLISISLAFLKETWNQRSENIKQNHIVLFVQLKSIKH